MTARRTGMADRPESGEGSDRARQAPRIAASLRERRNDLRPAAPLMERLLHELGAQPAFAEAVLGDLAEERARRRGQDGAAAADWWYAREAFRSAPHLAWNAMRHGGARGRVRAGGLLAAIALLPLGVLALLQLRDGPPAFLVVEGQRGRSTADGLVINNRKPVRLEMHVLDAKGRALPSGDVRYRWVSGTPLPVSPRGVVTCTRRGDATVRASVGTVATSVFLRCRPVREISADIREDLVAGGVPQDLNVTALGADHRPVDLIAGELRVEDSTIATLSGARIRPLAPGETVVRVRIGDVKELIYVSVFEPVRTLNGLRAGQERVIAPVHLARGDTIRWALPRGLFWLRWHPASAAQPMPDFAVDGPIVCMPWFGPRGHVAGCVVRGPGAWIRLTRSPDARGEIVGRFALEMRVP